MTSENKKDEEKLPRNFRIGILGALGSGKSTVAGLLHESRAGCFVIEENFGQNPYLARFYQDRSRWSFHSQSWFLMSKVEQYAKLAGRGVEILDPPLEMDRIYAQTQFEMGWMSLLEWSLYQRLYDSLIIEKRLKSPDLYIAVEASEEILLNRIKKRAESPERFSERWILTNCPEYPMRLARNVEHWVEGSSGPTPVLVIDTGVYDCATRAGRVQVAGMAEDVIKQVLSEKNFLPS
jgi:deoxyadenosine/deoxycytidine kinase